MAPELLKTLRERRERLLKRGEPFVRPLDLAKDAWVLWAAYDLKSFPSLPRGLKTEQLFELVGAWAKRHSQVLLIEANHKFYREKRGPIAMVTIDNFDWQIEPRFDFFFWATKRQRLAAAVAFLQMIRHTRKVGVCVVRVDEKDVPFCEHIAERYELLEKCGELPNASPSGTQYLFCRTGKREARDEHMREAA